MADIALHPDVADALREVQKKETLENIINFINKVIEKKEKCCSELVLEYGIKIMSEHEGEINKIDNFKIVEEVFLSALECKALDWADLTLCIIHDHISKSPKAFRYLAMFKEAKGEYQEAKNLYRELIDANPEDIAAYRRLAAFYRDSNLFDEAIEILNWGLKINQSDTNCWFELAELYVSCMNFSKAAYCFEEILVLKPLNYLYNLKYGEMLYSIGGGDNLLLARKYFSKAVFLNDNSPTGTSESKSVRAIFALLETCKRIEELGRKYQDETNEELIKMCKEKLDSLYEGTKFDISKLS